MAQPSPTIALAGAGDISALHGLAARALGLEVVAVADDDADRARQRAEQLGARACRPGELPAGADVVVVSGPVARHAADATRALVAGATVVVEPPLCATLVEADRLVELEAAHGRRLWHGEHLALAPVVVEALSQVRQLGPVGHLEVRASQPHAEASDPTADEVLAALAPRPLALCLLMAAPLTVVEVRAELATGAAGGPPERAEVRLRFDSGADAVVIASWTDQAAAWDLQASSDTGVVRAELSPTLGLERDGEPCPVPTPRPGLELPQLDTLGYLAQLEAVIAARATGRPATLGAAFGRQLLELVDAAHRSAARGGAPRAVLPR